jgi:CO/xanthine dehydrogenase FAD-binding subunit
MAADPARRYGGGPWVVRAKGPEQNVKARGPEQDVRAKGREQDVRAKGPEAMRTLDTGRTRLNRRLLADPAGPAILGGERAVLQLMTNAAAGRAPDEARRKHTGRNVPCFPGDTTQGVEVDLHTVAEVVSPAEVGQWRPGDAWLAGGTALFAEPRPAVTRLLDLAAAGWTPITVRDDGLEIAATCTVAELSRFAEQPQLTAFHGLVTGCCHAFLASFKIWNVATVGGNLCAALPAGPMIALTAALDGVCLLLGPDGERRVPVAEFVTGGGTTVLRDGELLRSVSLPVAALTGLTSYRQGSLFTHGRSAVLLAGRTTAAGGLVLTVTAATVRPYQLRFDDMPDERRLRAGLDATIPDDAWTDDVHGLPAWRRHLTQRFAQEIRAELAA